MSLTKWTLKRTSNPSELPVSLDEAKRHLRLALSDTTQDPELELLIIAAAERLERDINRQIISATYELTTCEFGDYILIPVRPVTSISSVQYLDTDGVSQTLTDYRFDEGRQAIVPNVGETFPSTVTDSSAVTVSFVAGYGSDADCLPRLIKAAILLCVGKWFFDPAQESSGLHSSEAAYDRIIRNLTPGIYP